jgi:GntR family transcriptional regulator
VAKELRISVIPVKKAWEDLEQDGLIYTMAGKGCFVSALRPAELSLKQDELAIIKLKKDIAYYKVLGISLEKLIDLIRLNYNE